jgi:hypothetical protein
MKKNTILITILFILISSSNVAQVTFEKGYVIDSAGRRMDCEIRYLGWYHNPRFIDYRLTGKDEEGAFDVNSVKEFGVTGYCRYIAADVEMDRSPEDLERLSDSKQPEWHQEKVFLKVLVCGQASLYSFLDNSVTRYFISANHLPVTQLIYKKYIDPGNPGYYLENKAYQRQLWTHLQCNRISVDDVESLSYEKKSLVKFVEKYNQCSDTIHSYTQRKKATGRQFEIGFASGINMLHLRLLVSGWYEDEINFRNNIAPSLNLKLEYHIPYGRNKWSLLISPEYTTYHSKTDGKYGTFKVDYDCIGFPLGVRHYLFLNNDLKIATELLFLTMLNIRFENTIHTTFSGPVEMKGGNTVAIGAGILWKKWFLEARHYFSQNLTNKYNYYTTNLRKDSLILGYSF